ncbi:MAG: LapA family protein [Nevskia sp.]|nr:LapA family protein [Nevskia sp.]
MLRILLLVLLSIVFLAGASLSYFNAHPVHFNYLVGSSEISLIVLLISAFALAVVLTLLLCSAKFVGLRAEIRGLRRQLRNTETELKNLRNLPPDSGV